MTTTLFRKVNNEAKMAADSRVSFVNDEGNVVNWIDSDEYLKVVDIDNTLFGFAGTNAIYKIFLINYLRVKDNSNFILDNLVSLAQTKKAQFSILRFDGELKLFSYSPPDKNGENEILRFSKDSALDCNMFAIGSGQYSKMYKGHRLNKNIRLPISKIISANAKAFKKKEMKKITKLVGKQDLKIEQSGDLYRACKKAGGDLFTGGKVNMREINNINTLCAKGATHQIELMNNMDQSAKANGLICASPINAVNEIQRLNRLGHSAVSKHKIDSSEEYLKLQAQMADIFEQSV